MPERPKYSRFRRMPGLYRIGEVKSPDPHEEPLPLTVYLPGRLLDMAEELAARHGAATIQEYCERLLTMAINDENAAVKAESVQITHGTFRSLDDLASDAESMAEWAASKRPEPTMILPTRPERAEMDPMSEIVSLARDAVLRHAGQGDSQETGLLATLRRGDLVSDELTDDLLAALRTLEAELRGAPSIDRGLAYALHRIGFEGEVLSYGTVASDPSTVDRIRRIQEGVDRVLSDQDVRYFTDGPGD